MKRLPKRLANWLAAAGILILIGAGGVRAQEDEVAEAPLRGAPSGGPATGGPRAGGPSEPSVRELQRRAVALAGLDTVRARAWESRLRRAALAPVMRVMVGRGGGNLETMADSNGNTKLTIGDHATWQFQITASWNLDKLVFHPEELRLAREMQRMAVYRDRLVVEVARLYYERRRLQLGLARDGALDGDEATEARLQFDQLTAELDGLTGEALSGGDGAVRGRAPVAGSPD